MIRKKVALFVTLISIIVGIITRNHLQELFFHKHKNLQSNDLLNKPFLIEEGASVHFFKNGFAVSGTNTKFFTHDGKEMNLPFKPEDMVLVGDSPNIDKSTFRYVLINNKFIYDTATMPFKLVYTAGEGSEGFDMREMGDALLIILKTEDKLLRPFFIQKDNIYAVDLNGIENSHYLDVSYDPITRGFSILALATDTPYPSSRVFNFLNGNSPQGMLSLNDLLFYKIYRTQKTIILVGIHQITCYNIDGSIKWNINAPNTYLHEAVPLDKGWVLYFPKSRFNGANALYVYSDGNREFLELPHELTNLQPYKDQQFIALDKNGNLVTINKSGNILKTFAFDIQPRRVYWSPYASNYLYVLSRDNMVYIYSLNKADFRKDE
ncbi:hypothetical protein JOD02_002138 [Caldicoprobacter guelmensis]|uniref:hypothetical protein n=1 Tax=Caldicoprobacter guelmensis TaxID=1170224 RepID=UPI001957DC0D|nr:hypothetical protein [Caldicoprobacter guelmensis]MBM7583257.1 hypothetical protein [Caldicoprobacter guelmensis]